MGDVSSVISGLCAVVHALQKERKRASLFALSPEDSQRNDYRRHNGETDAAIEACHLAMVSYEQTSSRTAFVANRLADIEQRLEVIGTLRDRVLQARITCTEAINHYTFGVNVPIIEAIATIGQTDKRLGSRAATVFDMFIQWKERFSRENAYNARSFMTGALKDKDFRNRMESLLDERTAWLEGFSSIASVAQSDIVKKVLLGRPLEKLAGDHKRLRGVRGAADKVNMIAGDWLASTDGVVDDLREAEGRLLKTLSLSDRKQSLAPRGARISASQELMITYLRPLELFASLSDAEIADLASVSSVKEYAKGHLFYTQGEPAHSVHIIVDGWVKVFNSTDSGEETILQMLSVGEMLMQSAVILNTNTPASAQAEERATVVSIPAEAIRKRINESGTLARSMLNNVSLKSQMMIYQMEQTRLKSAYDRVGWFLLRLSLDQGDYGSVFHLPYDKATIASYLDMRPETFSRALKAMKKVGIEVSNDHIEMEDQHSLCQFCDSYLANRCHTGGTVDCPRPELTNQAIY